MEKQLSALSVERLTVLLRKRYEPARRLVRRRADGTAIQINEHTDAESACQFGERFLQAIWNERRFREPMTTTDGRRLTVTSPGTWNVASGPDFKNAVLHLDDVAVHGDVEIHRFEEDWRRHGHHRDPRYESVVLHVVWQARPQAGKPAAGALPCVSLAEFVDRPWQALMQELELSAYPYARQVRPGACALRWALSADAQVGRLLAVAGLARFEDKSARLWRRAVAVGPAQALYEATFDALGYKANREAFRRLAEAIALDSLPADSGKDAWEALFFGCAGLLPDPSVTPVLPEWSATLRRLWDRWWESGREALGLHWQQAGARPFNSPERRLAAGIAWLERTGLRPDGWLLGHAEAASSPAALVRAIREDLSFRGAWSACRNFTARLSRGGALLGTSRVNDMLANVFLPFLAGARAAGHAGGEVSERAREAYFLLPALQENRLLREAVHRFLVPPSRSRSLLDRAAAQQGLLEIYRTFCLVLHGDCDHCPFAGFDAG